MSGRKAVIKIADMPYEMQQHAMDCAKLAFIKYKDKKDIARYMKEEFNKKYDRYWQCIVGSNFACSVNHDTQRYINFDLGDDEILLFKCG